MKVSVSLSDDDLRFLDAYATEHGLKSRSAVLKQAVRLLGTVDLSAAYEQAWAEWAADPIQASWTTPDADRQA